MSWVQGTITRVLKRTLKGGPEGPEGTWFLQINEEHRPIYPGEWADLPAQKGDFVCAKINEEGSVLQHPQVTIVTGEEMIEKGLQSSFRCGRDKANNMMKMLRDSADHAWKSVEDYLDFCVQSREHMTMKDLEEIFQWKATHEQITRFFEWWKKRNKRRLKLLGISEEQVKASKRTAAQMYEDIRHNPFTVRGLDWDTCVHICAVIGRKACVEDRDVFNVYQELYKSLGNGSTCSNLGYLKQKHHLEPDILDHLKRNGLVVEKDQVFMEEPFQTTKIVVEKLANLRFSECEKVVVDRTKLLPTLYKGQIQAILMALKLPLFVLTGPGGSGKSTVIAEICKQEPNVLLMAFTGKAVSHLKKICNTGSSTIHRVLASGIPKNIRHIVIDEASMVSTDLLRRFLEILPERVRLTLVGDVNQLPPIEWGECFHYLIKSKYIPKVRLNQVKRTKAGGIIWRNSQKLLEPQGNSIQPFFFERDSSFILQEGDVKDCMRVFKMWKEHNIRDCMIICPYNQAVDEINAACQKICQSASPTQSIRDQRGNLWCVGDPVINRVNNYGIKVMNGERGKILFIEDNGITVAFPNSQERFSTLCPGPRVYDEFDPDAVGDTECYTNKLSLGYATTVHGSQGSEWDNVLIYFPRHPTNLTGFINVRLVYTMVSRAKEKVWIIGDIPTLHLVANLPPKEVRDPFQVWLDALLKEEISKRALQPKEV